MLQMFRVIPYFSHWKDKEIKKFRQYFTEIYFKRNHTVYKEGDQPQHVYIIKSGEFEVIKKVKHHLGQNDAFLDILSTNPSYPRSINKMSSQNKKCAQIGKGNIFGEQEVVSNTPRTTTIK